MFHAFLLESYHVNVIVDRNQPVSLFLEIDDHEEWKVEEILDSEIKHNKLSYFVDWTEYSVDESFWKPASYLANAIDAVSRYHTRYSLRPSLRDLKPTNRRRWLVSQELDRGEGPTVMNASGARITLSKREPSS